MSEEERLKLENELLLTKSKAQMINMYLDVLSIIKKVRKNIVKNIDNTGWLEIGSNDVKELLKMLDKEEICKKDIGGTMQ